MVSLVPRPTLSFAVQFKLTLTRKWKSNEKGYQPTATVYLLSTQTKEQIRGRPGNEALYNGSASDLNEGLYKYYNIPMLVSVLVTVIRLGVGL